LSGLTNTDVAAVVTYTQSGSQYGLAAMKFQLVCVPVMFTFQEMSARIGAASGVGILTLTEQLLGRVAMWIAAIPLLLICLSTLFCEAAGMVAIADLIQVRRAYVIIAYSGVLVYNLMVSNFGEVVALSLSSLLSFFVFLAGVAVWKRGSGIGSGNLLSFNFGDKEFDLVVVSATLGTAITPFLLFYQCGAAVRGGATLSNLPRLRSNIFLGVILASLAAAGVLVSAAFSFWSKKDVGDIRSIQDCGTAFEDSMGRFGILIFVLGLAGAALTASFCTLETVIWIYQELFEYRHDFETDVALIDEQLQTIEKNSDVIFCYDMYENGEEQGLVIKEGLKNNVNRETCNSMQSSSNEENEALQQKKNHDLDRHDWPAVALCFFMLFVVDITACLVTDRQSVNLEILAQDFGCCLLPPALALGIYVARKVIPLQFYSHFEFKVHVLGSILFSTAAILPLLISALFTSQVS